MITAALLALALVRPDPALTPGAIRTTDMHDLCPSAQTASVRHITAATKREVFRRYHVAPRPGAYEIDHLISLELGGSNALTNLWPQPYHGMLNAHDKDHLENQLHALVCSGEITLAQAQHAIATDWIAAMAQYGRKAGPR